MQGIEAKQRISESMAEQTLNQQVTSTEEAEPNDNAQDKKDHTFKEIKNIFELGVYKERDPRI